MKRCKITGEETIKTVIVKKIIAKKDDCKKGDSKKVL